MISCLYSIWYLIYFNPLIFLTFNPHCFLTSFIFPLKKQYHLNFCICFFFAIKTINFLGFSLRFSFPRNSRNVVIGMKKALNLIPSGGEDKNAKEKELSQTPIKSLKFLLTFSFSFFYVLVLYYINWNFVDPGSRNKVLECCLSILFFFIVGYTFYFVKLIMYQGWENVFLPWFHFWFSCLGVFSSFIQIIIYRWMSNRRMTNRKVRFSSF
jgi:hypothetical protein